MNIVCISLKCCLFVSSVDRRQRSKPYKEPASRRSSRTPRYQPTHHISGPRKGGCDNPSITAARVNGQGFRGPPTSEEEVTQFSGDGRVGVDDIFWGLATGSGGDNSVNRGDWWEVVPLKGWNESTSVSWLGRVDAVPKCVLAEEFVQPHYLSTKSLTSTE